MGKTWINNTLKKTKQLKQKNKTKLQTVKKAKRETINVSKLTPIPKMDLAIRPDYDKLTMLLDMRTYSKSTLQDKLISKLDEHFTSLGGRTTKDKYGNLYVTKGKAEFYPCVVGHTDINQRKRENVKVMTAYPWIFGFDTDRAEQAGIGADDKVGVYFAVHMFDLFDNIKLFFPKDEEIGLIGTSQANKTFFTDCSMLVQLDRNSYNNDLITYTNGITVCSDEFVEAAKPIMDKYMYTKGNGSCTDIGGLKKLDTVNCVAMNVSCGYINEHSCEEVISIPHFENAINFGYELLKMGVDKVWTHEVKVPVSESNYFGRSYSQSYWNQDSLFDDFDVTNNCFKVITPVNIEMDLSIFDKSQNNYMNDLYPELQDNDFRELYLTHNLGDYENHLTELSQNEIDTCLSEHTCPSCWSDIRPDNSLLVYTSCSICGCTWNIPNSELDDDSIN
jgi:hypothetical protein